MSTSSSSTTNVLRQSLARGAALARHEAAQKEAARAAEQNKMDTARALMERRKSYGRVQRRAASPAKPLSLARPSKPKAPAKRAAAPNSTPNKGGAKKRVGTVPAPPRAPPPLDRSTSSGTSAPITEEEEEEEEEADEADQADEADEAAEAEGGGESKAIGSHRGA